MDKKTKREILLKKVKGVSQKEHKHKMPGGMMMTDAEMKEKMKKKKMGMGMM